MKDELLIKYIQKKCSEKELQEVRDWLLHEKDHRRLFELEDLYALKVEQYYQNPTNVQSAYEQLKHKLNTQVALQHPQKPASHRWRNYLAYAAMLAILCLLSVNLYFLKQKSTEPSLAYNTIQVPKGQRVFVTLSDGTKVWLNAESEFSYPGIFASDTRHVILKGEAFFQVTSNPKNPFTVQLPSLNIKVLGTTFNAKAYQGENHCITLQEGVVEVSTKNGHQKAQMKPKDQVIYTSQGNMKIINNSQTPSTNDWIRGELRIENQELQEFISDMERHFNVNIHIQESHIQKMRFTCHFKNNLTIQEALDLLKATKQVDYIIDNNDIYLYKYKP